MNIDDLSIVDSLHPACATLKSITFDICINDFYFIGKAECYNDVT